MLRAKLLHSITTNYVRSEISGKKKSPFPNHKFWVTIRIVPLQQILTTIVQFPLTSINNSNEGVR